MPRSIADWVVLRTGAADDPVLMLDAIPSARWCTSGPAIMRATALSRSCSGRSRSRVSTKTIAVKEPRKADKAECVSMSVLK